MQICSQRRHGLPLQHHSIDRRANTRYTFDANFTPGSMITYTDPSALREEHRLRPHSRTDVPEVGAMTIVHRRAG